MEPTYFDEIVKVTKELAGYNPTNVDGEYLPSFKTPSVPLKVGYALKSLILLMKGFGLRRKNEEMIKNVDFLESLYRAELGTLISSASIQTLEYNKFNKKVVLPLTEDLIELKNYCTDNITKLTKELQDKPLLETWRSLCEIVVTGLTVINKGRGNEASNFLIKNFESRNEQHKMFADSILKSLSPLQKKLVQR